MRNITAIENYREHIGKKLLEIYKKADIDNLSSHDYWISRRWGKLIWTAFDLATKTDDGIDTSMMLQLLEAFNLWASRVNKDN